MHLWYLQMKGIQFLLCLIALHTVVGNVDFIGSSIFMTFQDKINAVDHINRCEKQGIKAGYCVANLMSNTDPDNEWWCCKYASGNKKIPIHEKFQKWFMAKTPTGKYSCTWKDPLDLRCG